MIRRVYRLGDGSQLLVSTWLEGDEVHQEISTRSVVGDTWGPPVRAQYADDDATPEHGLAFPA